MRLTMRGGWSMRRIARMSVWMASLLILTLAVAGCGLFGDREQMNPVSPAGSGQLPNFWVGQGQNKYVVTTQPNEMELSVPQGAYLLEYTTTYGTFYILFKATMSVTLYIGLEAGDVVKEALLYPGEIDPAAEVIESKTGYEVYQLPEFTSAQEWYETFEGDFEIIVLISDGKIMLPVGGLEATAEEESETPDDAEEESETTDEETEAAECAEGKYQVTVTAEGAGTVKPDGSKCVPAGASISLKFKPDSKNFEDLTDVTINGEPMLTYVRKLGNGSGHLVVHGVDAKLDVVATFAESESEGKDKPDKGKDKD